MDGIENVCNHLPEPVPKICKEEVEKMLPLAITFITAIVVSCWTLHQNIIRCKITPACFVVFAVCAFLTGRFVLNTYRPISSSVETSGGLQNHRALQLLWQAGEDAPVFHQGGPSGCCDEWKCPLSAAYRRTHVQKNIILRPRFDLFVLYLLCLRCLSIRCRPHHNAPSAFSLSRLWRSCCLQKGLRWVTIIRWRNTCTWTRTICISPTQPQGQTVHVDT